MKRIYTTINKKGNLNNISKEELLKIEDITGEGGTGIQSIQGGDNISIDNTDPLNPIVSTTGGGTTGNYIPLTGTEVGKPVTGLIELIGGGITLGNSSYIVVGNAWRVTNSGDIGVSNDRFVITGENVQISVIAVNNSFTIRSGTSYIRTTYNGSYNTILLGTDPNSSGLEGIYYWGDKYTDNCFIQKKYADKQHSYSETEIKTGGTWIDNKPLYKKTQLTSDPAPTVGTMIKSTVVGGIYTEYEYTQP